MWYDTPRLLCQLEIEYTDGSTELVVTDDSWKTTTGPLQHDAIFTGEEYDARLELDGWNRNGYKDSSWKKALLVRAPKGSLHAQLAPHEKIIRILQPVSCEQKDDSTYWYAFPEMISGWAHIKVQGNAGDRIKLRFVGEEKMISDKWTSIRCGAVEWNNGNRVLPGTRSAISKSYPDRSG